MMINVVVLLMSWCVSAVHWFRAVPYNYMCVFVIHDLGTGMTSRVINKSFQQQLAEGSDDCRVLVVEVRSARRLPYVDTVSGTSGPFCRINVLEQVGEFDQLQRTSRE